jgi:nitrous oxidase accessory protein
VVLEGRPGAVLQGDGTGSVVTVLAPGTELRGLTVRGSGRGPTGNPAAIRIEADRVTVERVSVEDSYMGLAVEGATDVRLIDNVIRGRAGAAIVDERHAVEHEGADGASAETTGDESGARGDGIWLHDADHVLVRGNRISDSRDGVYVSFGTGALLDGNEVTGSRYAVHSMFASQLTLVENHLHGNLSGAVLMYRGPVLLLRNHIEGSSSPSTGFGVLLKDVVEVEAVQNVVVDNRVGFHLDGPTGAQDPGSFVANTVARNVVGVAAYPSARASFRANSFVHNRLQVQPQGGQLRGLAFSDQGWGNLWSTYRGYEARTPGRGAVPHVEGGAVDRLLGRHPELLAIADGPAFRLLRSIEERWGRQAPVLVDELPITIPVSPPVPAAATDPLARPLGVAVAAALLTPLLALVVWQRPHRAVSRRWQHAVAA